MTKQKTQERRKGTNKVLTLKGIIYSISLFLLIFVSVLWQVSPVIAQGLVPPPTGSSTFNTWTGNLTNGSELHDFHIVSPTNGQILVYLTSTNQWYNQNPTYFYLSNFNNNLNVSNFPNDAGYYNSSNFVISNYYLKSNPFNFYNSTSLTTNSQLLNGNNYWNDTYATFNKTYADTIYYPRYSNPEGYYNSSDFLISNYFTKSQIEGFNYFNLTTEGNIKGSLINNDLNWINSSSVNGSYYPITNPYGFWNGTYYGGIGNWSSDKSSYYTSSQTDTAISNANTSLKNYVDGNFPTNTDFNSIGNWSNDKSSYSTTSEANALYKSINVKTWNDTYATFNKTYADGLYAPIGITGTITGSGSSGYIPLWNGTTSINSSAIFQSSGQVGIGTTSLGSGLLTIAQQTDNSMGGIRVQNSGNNRSMQLWVSGTTPVSSVIDSGTTGTGQLFLNRGGGGVGIGYSETTTLSGLNINESVGIGTTSPSGVLDVKSSGVSTDFFRAISSSGSGGFIVRETSSNNPFLKAVNSSGTTVFQINTDASGTSYINNGGNFGIGTSNPGSPLEVNGNVQVGNSNQDYVIQFATQRGFLGYKSTALSSGAMVIQGGGGNKGIEFNVNSGTFGSGTAMVILNNSNVGIGTTSPQTKLDISGGTVQGLPYTSVGALVIKSDQATAGTDNYGSGISFNALGYTGVGQKAGIVPVQTTSDADQLGLAFLVHSSAVSTADLIEAMRITSSGKVGIGTTNPVTLFHIYAGSSGYNTSLISNTGMTLENNGNININLLGAENNTGTINFGDNANYQAGRIAYNHTDNTLTTTISGLVQLVGTGNSWDFQDNNIYTTGKIGIGTTAPDSYLTIGGGTTTNHWMNIYGDNTGGSRSNLTLYAQTDQWLSLQSEMDGGGAQIVANRDLNIISQLDRSFYFKNSSGTVMYLNTSSGRLGIGTTNPQNTLNVVGDANVTGTIYGSQMSATWERGTVTAGQYWATGNGASTAQRTMNFNGTIIALGGNCATTGTAMNVSVRVNNVATLSIPFNTTSLKSAIVYGSVNINAGDVFGVYGESASGTWSACTASVDWVRR